MQHTLPDLSPPATHFIQQSGTGDTQIDKIITSKQTSQCFHDGIPQIRVFMNDAVGDLLAGLDDELPQTPRRESRQKRNCSSCNIRIREVEIVPDASTNDLPLLPRETSAAD
jgi:hypothetical protein